MKVLVVICLKISTFVVSTTTQVFSLWALDVLWFAWKYLPLWYQQQPRVRNHRTRRSCDLLENIYLCGINNNRYAKVIKLSYVVICLKISTFVVSTTTRYAGGYYVDSCDLLENIYLCGINNNWNQGKPSLITVVICLKISTFVVSTTTIFLRRMNLICCDLLENIYLCGINNNSMV